MKLSPGTANLVEVATAAMGAGAAALTLVNTLPALAIRTDLRRGALGGGGGGLSGPALHAVALRAVADVAEALPAVPIIGVGGVMSGIGAVEFLLAGASAVEVGTATLLDPHAPAHVLAELRRWCAANGSRTGRRAHREVHMAESPLSSGPVREHLCSRSTFRTSPRRTGADAPSRAVTSVS